MDRRVKAAGYATSGFLLQRMVPEGAEMLVGVAHEPRFGPIIACGAGGTAVELLGDVQFRLAPLSKEDAQEMVRSLRTYPLLTGYRGRPPYDVAALEDLLARVSALVQDLPQVAEMDCNPVIVFEQGIAIVDARVRVAAVPPPAPLGARGT